MGGLFPEGKEANFSRPDPGSTVFCLANWTKEVVFCGWEIGERIITGDLALKAELNPENPMYRLMNYITTLKGAPVGTRLLLFCWQMRLPII